MFDIGAGELLVIGVVSLIVIGPKELPGLLRTMGQSAAKLRRMAGEFRQQFDEAMREAELHDAQKTVAETADLAKSAVTGFNPIETIRKEIKSTVDEIKGAGAEAQAAINAPVVTPDPAPAVTPVVVEDPGPPISVLAPPPDEPAVAEAKPKRTRKKPAENAE